MILRYINFRYLSIYLSIYRPNGEVRSQNAQADITFLFPIPVQTRWNRAKTVIRSVQIRYFAIPTQVQFRSNCHGRESTKLVSDDRQVDDFTLVLFPTF